MYFDTVNGQNRFFTKQDHETLVSHEITEEELENWLGEDYKDDLRERTLELLKGDYTVKQFRYDVISYNDLLQDKPILNYLR